MEKEILDQFLYKNKLKFNEIEKSLKIRSNKLTYHLNKLIQKNILTKTKDSYSLSKSSEYLIPYLSNKNPVLPVILVSIKKKEKIFLIKRKKRPFIDKLGIPGGRLLMGETIKAATKRILKEKYNISCEFSKVNSISLEHVKKQNKIIHSFLLIFVTAKTNDKIDYINPNNNKNKIIPSDYNLIKNQLTKKTNIQELITEA
jgi:ADP-ribose pyrophosphatase YjhB (NUDIX family)